MYPYFLIAETPEGQAWQSVFTDCLTIFNLPHPDTGKRYILAKKFSTLAACTCAFKELVPNAEYIVETYLQRKNSKKPQMIWHRIPRNDTKAA